MLSLNHTGKTVPMIVEARDAPLANSVQAAQNNPMFLYTFTIRKEL